MQQVTTLFDFLPYVKDIYALSKTLPFYSKEEFPEKSSWPGVRTNNLKDSCPFLYIHILTLLQQSININFNEYKNISMYCHLRLQEDQEKDWIHTDPSDTVIVYLSPTNLNSGTDFYDNRENTIASVKFIQGTCVFFKEGIKHCSIGNHGDSIDNGRMTINLFMTRK